MKIENASIITVRNSSKRLPNKTVAKIRENIMAIDIMIERAKKTNFPVILATSSDSTDDSICEIGKKHKIEVFRGSLLNKIKRWQDCFEHYAIENALLIDGDDLCYEIAKRAMSELIKSNSDIISSPENIVTGLFTLAVTKNAIKKLYQLVPQNDTDTDLFTHYFQKAKLKISYVSLKEFEKNKNIRLTLDYKEDLEFFRKLYNSIDIIENGETIIKFLEQNKSIVDINFRKQQDFLKNKKIKEIHNE